MTDIDKELYTLLNDLCENYHQEIEHGNQQQKSYIPESIAKIKALVVESLPKEVSVTDEDFNIPKGEPASISLLRADCYNQCLGEIRSIFK